MARSTGKPVFVGIKGSILALERATGRQLWQTPLKGSDFVNLVLDGDDLLATTRGEVFCLDPASGRIRWNNPLKGMGWGLATIATSYPAAMKPAMAEYRRQQEAAQSSGG